MLAIKSFIGSITDQRIGADAIVNASNPGVKLGSGVSAAIRTPCGGLQFQERISEQLEEKFEGKLGLDDCLVTDAGSQTEIKWVIHVPAVDYGASDPETGGPTGPNRISTCLITALYAASELAQKEKPLGAFALAVPLRGAGAGHLGTVVAVDIIMGALRSFLSISGTHCAISSVIIVVMTENDRRLLRLAGEKYGIRVVELLDELRTRNAG